MRSVAAILRWSSLILLGVALSAGAQETKPLQLEDLFPRKSFFGKTARSLAWSHDDRYLAYLWNPYDDQGFDLWLYDVQSGKSRRLTSLEQMLPFDRELQPILERYKKEREEEEKRKKLSREEREKLEREEEEKERERRTPQRDYTGISSFVWARKGHEILFTYQGDLFRLPVPEEGAQPQAVRLTRTRDAESDPRYTGDDSGFYFRRTDGIYRMRFNSPVVEQVNPALPNNLPLQGYRLSPDERWLLISTSRSTGTAREVTYVTYRERFAKAQTVNRGVADDPFKSESYLFLCDLQDEPGKKADDLKPWQLWKWPPEGTAPEEYGQLSLHEQPFSADSRRVVFGAWAREKKEVTVHIADTTTRKVNTVFTDSHAGEHTTPSQSDPFFTPDGNRVVTMLERSGYRHAWLIDPLAQGATQLTRGDFEVYPLKPSPDGKRLLVRSSKELPARMDLYYADLTDGALQRLTTRAGNYLSPELSHSGRHLALTYGAWGSPRELCVLQIGDATQSSAETSVTQSHPGTFATVDRLRPSIFSYKNRHGHTIWGYLFLPKDHKKGEKRPLMIHVYGGPLGERKQVTDGTISAAGYLFNLYLAERMGYITCVIDPRGSSGYGGAFGSANWEQVGKPQVEDLVDGVKYLTATYGVDEKKVGINGWSFGGFQTQMCLYTAPEVFTLGIAGAGPTEWQNYNTWYSGGVVGKSRPGKPEDLDKYSLTKLAKNLRSPLMLVHGVEDTNVLFQDTVKVYRSLLQAGKGPLVELVLDPTGGHGLGGDIRAKQQYQIYLAFLQKHWGPYRPTP